MTSTAAEHRTGVASRPPITVRLAGGAYLALAGVILPTAFWGLRHDVGWIAQPFYAYVWWGYILLLDGFCALRRGHSLLTTRARFALPMMIWSVSFWVFFELLNIRFHNWYYVGVPRGDTWSDLLGYGTFVFAAFSTVFVGLFETFEALTAAGLWRRLRGRPGRLPPWASYAVQGLGAGMAGLAICFPHYLAPLIWGSFTFLVDPWNYRRGARSILRDIEARDWGLVLRLFTAGLVCGVVWESMNFFAPQKWIYTVRGLEELKIFEMPLLGFLGFPALAYDCMAGFALLSTCFLGGATWEHPSDLSYALPAPRRTRPGLFAATLPAQVLFWAAVAGMNVNVGSVALSLDDLPLTAAERTAANDMGIERPRQLARAARTDAATVMRHMGWDARRLEAAINRIDLVTFKGIGGDYGRALQRLGVRRVEDLATQDPPALHAALLDAGHRFDLGPPRLDMVRVWVLASRDRGMLLRTGP